MNQNYKTIFFGFEEAEKRLEIYTCESSLVLEEVFTTLSGLFTCKPRFLIYVEGALKAEVDGVDYTKIENTIQTYIPSLDD